MANMFGRPRKAERHPYLSGNFAPVKRELPLTQSKVVEGSVPKELFGGEYVRNGGNPLKDNDESRDAHWFDGDGMLTGVLFNKLGQPYFVNRYILTDVLLSTSKSMQRPLLPSIATFAAPFSLWGVTLLFWQIIRTALLSVLSWLPLQRRPALKRISAANTSIWWHDGQAFAGCESGPPIRIMLPGLETADWWTGESESWASSIGPLKMLSEFTTAHPRIDPQTQELLLYHMSFVAPYLRISVIPPRSSKARPIVGAIVPGLPAPRLSHDFCATSKRTVLIDMPLSLDPSNLLAGKPMLHYEHDKPTRFGIFPRHTPQDVRWYESEGCCIYHAANAWDEQDTTSLVACRLNSATLVYAAGNIATPEKAKARCGTEKCQMYYWQFDTSSEGGNAVLDEFALSDIPVEFPTMNDAYSQRKNRFVYGASMTSGTFDAGLGTRTAKIDCLAKFDIDTLIRQGASARRRGKLQRGQAYDPRTVQEILTDQRDGKANAIRIFALPAGHYAQEATFIPRKDATSEDDGYLVFFVFDESRNLDSAGQCKRAASSQLWIIDAQTMIDVVCKIELPQRVPYGLHGHFFSADEIANQRPVDVEAVRNWALARSGHEGVGMGGFKVAGGIAASRLEAAVNTFRDHVERLLA